MLKKRLKKYMTKFVGKRLNTLYSFAPEKAVRKSLKLFIRPRKGKVNALQELILEKAERFAVNVDTLQLQGYYWPGGEKKVLLAHGWESNSARWDELITHLEEENYGILALDAPAHGGSEGKEFSVPVYARGISALADHYKPAFMIGHSIGGATLLFQLHKTSFPGLEKMVLLAPPSDLRDMMDDFQVQLNLKTDLMRDMAQEFEGKFQYDLSDFSMLNCTKDATEEALFIHDRTDKIVDWKASLAIVDQWENSRFFVTRGYGHSLKNPEVYSAILEFLNPK